MTEQVKCMYCGLTSCDCEEDEFEFVDEEVWGGEDD